MEIKNAAGNIIPATYVSASSCWGCAFAGKTRKGECPSPGVPYTTEPKHWGCRGEAWKIFDGISNSASPSQWWCSDNVFGGAGSNSASIMFTLDAPPAEYSLKRPYVTNDWCPKDWTLQHQQADGTWLVISTVTGKARTLSQDVKI
jgi:hypothetical protein